MRALVAELGLGPVAVVGHDRGARVAHRWALDHPATAQLLFWRPVPSFEPTPASRQCGARDTE